MRDFVTDRCYEGRFKLASLHPETAPRDADEFRNAIWFDEPRRERVLGFFTNTSSCTWWSMSRRDFAQASQRCGEKKGPRSAAERFNYLYSETELRSLARYAKELAEKAAEMHTLFNNCYRDYGQRNAMEFQRLLQQD